MKIQNIGYQNKICSPLKPNKYLSNQNYQQDSFVFSNVNNNSEVSFKGGFLKKIMGLGKKSPVQPLDFSKKTDDVENFHVELAMGINEVFDEYIPPENLTSILSPEAFRLLLPAYNTSSFICNEKAIENGVYCADLDYETNFTKGGKKDIFSLMDEMAKFSDIYYQKTGQNFIFATADRDTLKSAQHIVRIIGENPEKFKHLRYVPACKVSYTHEAPNSKLEYENSSLLIYGINPFSSNLETILHQLSRKRKSMIINFISVVNHLYPEFSYQVREFAKQNQFMYEKDYAVSNLYWRAREYAEGKGEKEMKSLNPVPEDIIREANDIIDKLGTLYVGPGYEEFEGADSKIDTSSELNKTIKGIFERYSTHIDKRTGVLVSSAETIFSSLISCLHMEDHQPIMAFAAPYYLCHDFDKPEDYNAGKYPKVVDFMKKMRQASNGMISAFQSIVPMYALDKNLSLTKIKEFNSYLQNNSDFYEVGGSIIHEAKMPLIR